MDKSCINCKQMDICVIKRKINELAAELPKVFDVNDNWVRFLSQPIGDLCTLYRPIEGE